MPDVDRLRWNARYEGDERFSSFERPRAFLVENSCYLPRHGRALDVAMGVGGNAAFLSQHGLQVIGVDISDVALCRARKLVPGLAVVQADLPHFSLPDNTFDVILNFFYLQRDLWSAYVRWLRPGGILVFESLTIDMLTVQPEIDPQYLLQPGELQQGFQSLQILVYREGWAWTDRHYPRAVASLLARKPPA
jgi:SAM-dependent methyltransferase